MKALLLEDSRKLVVRDVPEPTCGKREAIIKVGAVGVCGTDFHIYSGEANYNFDGNGRVIPFRERPQILGHEFCGTVVKTGSEAGLVKVGDRVAVDQGLNCFSQEIDPVCEYCATGFAHQCQHYKERGITGLPGAMQEFVSMPVINVVKISDSMSFEETALSEPLGCILHALDMVDQAHTRYTLSESDRKGTRLVENILILGAGPAGILFLQSLRKVKDFKGRIFVADFVEEKLALAERFDGTPINLQGKELAAELRRLTRGEGIHLVIEASGHGSAFASMSTVLRKQGTVLLYGHGHQGTDLSVINHLMFIEPMIVVSCGASGSLDTHTHQPELCRRTVELIGSGLIDVKSLITHRYGALEEVDQAFSRDHKRRDYIKGVLVYR
ncbi:MAG: zinc-dependent alcohol dehydrogenase [Acidobacteriota bacterium]